MIKNIGDIAKIIGKEETELKEAMSSDKEVEIEIPQGEFYTAEKLTELKNNITEEIGKTKYTEGKDAGREMTVGDIYDYFKLTYEGKKDAELLKRKLPEKILADAKIDPNKKFAEYEESITNLQTQIETLQKEKDKVIEGKEEKINRLETEYLIRRNIKGKLKGVRDDQVSLMFRSEYDVAKDDKGQVVVKKDGKVLKDAMEKPLALDVVLNTFIAENNWYEKDGRGGGDQGAGGATSYKNLDEVFKDMKQNNIDPMSEQGMKIIADAKEKGLKFAPTT